MKSVSQSLASRRAEIYPSSFTNARFERRLGFRMLYFVKTIAKLSYNDGGRSGGTASALIHQQMN